MSPFEALYGIPPPIHIPYFPNDTTVVAVDVLLRDREATFQMLKHNLLRAATRMKVQADKHQVERTFNIGDWVLLKLQACRQLSVWKPHHKFEAKYFGPYQILDKVGEVAYKLSLPSDAQIYNVFHVSQLKPSSPPRGPVPQLPPISRVQEAYPLAILERRMARRHNQAVAQWLIHWKGYYPADATWKYADDVEAKESWEGGIDTAIEEVKK